MKRFWLTLLPLATLALVLLPYRAAYGLGPLDGKIIALDAGHGGEEWGATYPANADASTVLIKEKDVNLAVVYALKSKLEKDGGASVVLTREGDEYLPSRRERVEIAISKCESSAGRKCDALVSVHHNGSVDPGYDGLLVIYNERQDLALAKAVHDALEVGVSHPPGGSCSPYNWTDEGLRNGGYGMTVYGHLVSIITEAYYITNECEGQYFQANAANRKARIAEEVNAIYSGLANYFSAQSGGRPGR
ncbi:MAG TPA: N-acetylmuramoyl-L-alanine amidase [Dehalococcoidia bacterium]|nr:N-acetylmuramoyl-L-alanine amidase [Dehalococcoidia bacterium]